jgi:dTDP-4-amino-4,6-dideoxy-D-glucose acyltransferase
MTDRCVTHYSSEELRSIGLGSVGESVFVDRTCRFHGPGNITLGSHVRIDAYCVLSAGEGGIAIGSFVHLATGVSIVGCGRVVIEDFAGLSAKVSVFSSNDDYTGGSMTNPMVPVQYRNITIAPITVRRHAIVGAGSVVLPGVEIGIGAAVGALTLVRKSVRDFAIVSGNPMCVIGERGRQLLDYEKEIRASLDSSIRCFYTP